METTPTTQLKSDDRVTMTEKEFAQKVGISVTTCCELRKKKRLPHCKVGRRILYLPEHVNQFLSSIEQQPKAA